MPIRRPRARRVRGHAVATPSLCAYHGLVDLEPYLRTLRRRDRDLRAARRARAAAVRDRLPEVIRILVGEFGADRVVLFGSLCRGELHERADLDLAVTRLAPEDYFRALARLAEVAGVPVDLVPLEEAGPSLRARIEAEGQVLHGG